jgi:ProP effector
MSADGAAVLELLAERFPNSFALHQNRRRPLKVGIHKDIVAALDGAVMPAELCAALRCYVRSAGYLRSMVAGADRIDLDGRPCGTVTEDEAEYASMTLARRKANAAATAPKAADTPQPAPPKRLGLADLKAAAQRRKQSVQP